MQKDVKIAVLLNEKKKAGVMFPTKDGEVI